MPTLSWIGKEKVVNHHQEVPYRVLEHKYGFRDGKQSDKETNSGNLIIHGDNLLALKSLLPKYQGKVNCIYIDPPYNTGEEAWEYNDNVNDERIKEWLGKVVGIEGEDFTRHDKWLCMIYPRLVLLKKLLSETGVIFISIDDNEQSNLRQVCNEIFGINCFVATFIWEKRKNRENRKVVSYRHDYILCYCKSSTYAKRCLKPLPMSAEALKRYQNPDNDVRGLWKSDPATAQAGHATESQFYTLIAPNGKKHELPNGRCWLYTEDEMNQAIKEGRIWFGKSGNNVPRIKTYLNEKERGLTPETILFAKEVSTNEGAKNNLKEIFPERTLPFRTPKPVQLIEYLLRISTDENSIILDSFAGSGTTAHAVLKLNKEGGNRHFILAEMEDYADSLTAERNKRAICGYGKGKKAVNGTGGSFDYYELGEPLFLEDGTLNEVVGEDKIREYIFFSETQQTPLKQTTENKYYLGKEFETAYYFFYEQNQLTTLNHETLRQIVKERAEQYIIYADICTLTEEEMNGLSVIFKKIPRDIKRF